MKGILCFITLSLFKLITAQMLPYAMTGTNGIANTGSALQNLGAAHGPMAGHAMQSANYPVSNGYTQTPTNMVPGSYLSTANLVDAISNPYVANSNMEYAAISNPVQANLAVANSAATTANINAVKTANAILSAENAGNNLLNGNNAYENILANAEDLKQLNNLSPVLNGNMATFYLGNNGNTFTVTSGSPGTQGIGVQIMADALEVGGTVAVNGRIPIYGMVGINGNIPTDGMASVSYSCANPSTLL